MKVKNYYKLSKDECVQSLHEIREWLFRNPNHPQIKKAVFALHVCLNAIELERDDFIQTIIDNLT